ncbi:uncharacterized protein B0I36DRAFT_313165 [Microdochium trichocladiopsis]|uniref:Uncharacterized protein n=1 Tax=Microdochium trichocladiopsis TaxID=1682393 RepID=A0A9P8YD39_9PEZI|nr:uncharacterized protein B0I36DRAFT_313165 [Microdochium trichocladiopsis]KAH7037024.1 hypothetical protein B0I36DRAFT_313165 [Microdochium trichocladiopsis]
MEGKPHLQLLSLPTELRQYMWAIYYREVDRPWLRYAVDVGSGIESQCEIPKALASTCKQIFEETRPFIGQHGKLDLHIVYPPYMPTQLPILPAKDLRKAINHIIFHVADISGGIAWDYDRPPKRPVKFHRFPNLTDFTVCVPTHVPIQELFLPESEQRSTQIRSTFGLDGSPGESDEYIPAAVLLDAQNTYRSLTADQKVALWKNRYSAKAFIDFCCRVGRGGWLSRVVDPGTHPLPLALEADIDTENTGDAWDTFDEDYEGSEGSERSEGEEDSDAAAQTLTEFRAVAARLRVVVECELWATARGGPHNSYTTHPIDSEPLLLRLDPRRVDILEMRPLGVEESILRSQQSKEAS